MSKNNGFWDKIFDKLDTRYINEVSDEINKNLADEGELHEIIVDRPKGKKIKWRVPMAITAAAVLIAGGLTFRGKFTGLEKPAVSVENTTGYGYATVYKNEKYYIDISLYDNNWVTETTIELIELINSIELHKTEYAPKIYEEENFTIRLEKQDGSEDIIRVEECYKDGVEPYYFLTKNDVIYEVSEEDYYAVYSLFGKFTNILVPVNMSGNYYLNDNVYLTLDSSVKSITLKGSEAYDFIFEQEMTNAGVTEASETFKKEIDGIYKKYSDTVFYEIFISEGGALSKLNEGYRYELRLPDDDYIKPVFYYNNGSTNKISFYGYEFKREKVTQIEYTHEFHSAKINFTELDEVHSLGINGIAMPFEDEAKAKEFYSSFTGNDGIERIGETILEDASFEPSTYCDMSNDTKYAFLSYKTEDDGILYITACVDETDKRKIRLPWDTKLYFPENNETVFSKITDYDGKELDVKIGGVRCGSEYYYLAEWMKDGLNYCVSTKNISVVDFLDVLATLIIDTDEIGGANFQYVDIPSDKSLYTLDFQIFYDSFRGIWTLNEDRYISPDGAVSSIYTADPIKEINLGWNDNLFSYTENDLIGFYRTDYASYMLGESIVCVVIDNDPDTMYMYPVANTAVGYETSGEWLEYTKTSDGDVMGFTGMYGRLGFLELCENCDIDPEWIFDTVVVDKDGNHWTRPRDRFVDFPDVGVSKRQYGEIMLHIELTCSETRERKYFSFSFKGDDLKSEEGDIPVMSDEHYPYDPGILSVEAFPTELALEVYEDVQKKAEEYSGYSFVTEVEFYPCPDGSYYAVRVMGSNQAQWLSDFEVLYNDGNGYTVISDEYTTFMGMVICASEENRFYIAYKNGNETDDEIFIDCIVNGNVVSSYELPYAEGDNNVSGLSVSDKELTVEYEIYSSTGLENRYVKIGYDDPYNPELLASSGVVTAEPEQQEPLSGYRQIQEVGTHLHFNSITPSYMSMPREGMYEITANEASNIAYANGEMIVLTLSDEKDFSFSFNDRPYISVIPDCSAEYSDSTGELVEIGYIKNNFATELYSGKLPPEGLNLEFIPPENGEYRFYILNCSENIQNYKLVGIAVS